MNLNRQVTYYAVALSAVLIVASCARSEADPETSAVSNSGTLGKDFGNAVAHNAAQQILDPVPANVLAGAPDLDGGRAEGAYRRYRTGQVTAPESLETTDFGTDR